MPIPEKVRAALASFGREALEFEAGSTPTVASAAARLGVEPGQIAKSLLFKGKRGDYHMVVCAGDKRISSSRLKLLMGSKPGMTDAAETEAVTGFLPGGVCPFGLREVSVWIDSSLESWPQVYPAAGTDGSAVRMDYASLLEITGGKSCSVAD
jgi:prolyl-tRNA editing enzyme YbaK/EbsC (Cys-tRNA(Pro) deacylase)